MVRWIDIEPFENGIFLNPWRESAIHNNILEKMHGSLTRERNARKIPLESKSLEKNLKRGLKHPDIYPIFLIRFKSFIVIFHKE